MTKAQKIRSKRLSALEKALESEAEKIFNWILDLMDADTKRGYFGPMEILLWYDQNGIKTPNNGIQYTVYDLSEVLLKYDRVKLFTVLDKLINEEDGFKSDLSLNAERWESKAIILKVTIEN